MGHAVMEACVGVRAQVRACVRAHAMTFTLLMQQ